MRKIPLQWVGIGLGLFYWFLESAVDAFIFHKEDLFEEIFTSDPYEIWIRLLVIGILILFCFYAQIVINERKEAQEEVEKSLSLLHATIESTADGILVVNNAGKMITFNKRFIDMWCIPEYIVASQDDNQAQAYVLDQLKDPEGFLVKVRELYSHPDAESHDVLEFKDGRIFDRFSKSQRIDGHPVGRVCSFRDVTERKQAEEEIRHLAYYDILTDLPNRLMFHDSIDRAISMARSENKPFAIIVINLNRFDEINNTLGYHNGDIILQQIGKRLQGALDKTAIIARPGGDKFAVILSNVDAEGVMTITNEIIERLKDPFVINGFSVDISSSIGISLFPGHGEDADTLVRRANIAMHMAKKTESSWNIYSSQYDQFIPERLVLMAELRHAIDSDQLFLLYQPKIDLNTCKAIGAEALVRWQHPKSGIIPPDQFISLAEHTGIIKELTFWVLKEALRQSRRWQRTGLDISVSVNLSVRSLQSPLFLDQIKGLLATWGVDPRRLRLEITESIIMSDPDLAMEIITQLTLMGIRFSIDDFGTGYSSLRYLQKLPVDEIKIDKSFVMHMMEDENNIKIVRSTIELGHSLGLKVTAEGVENQEAMDRLASLGCDAAQGYFISRPVSREELVSWLGRQG